jgi:hypothetical protein
MAWMNLVSIWNLKKELPRFPEALVAIHQSTQLDTQKNGILMAATREFGLSSEHQYLKAGTNKLYHREAESLSVSHRTHELRKILVCTELL